MLQSKVMNETTPRAAGGVESACTPKGGVSCPRTSVPRTSRAFETTSKRRRGFPSETCVKRGERVVHGDKELIEKLGRNDPCVCGSTRRFQKLLHGQRRIRR